MKKVFRNIRLNVKLDTLIIFGLAVFLLMVWFVNRYVYNSKAEGDKATVVMTSTNANPNKDDEFFVDLKFSSPVDKEKVVALKLKLKSTGSVNIEDVVKVTSLGGQNVEFQRIKQSVSDGTATMEYVAGAVPLENLSKTVNVRLKVKAINSGSGEIKVVVGQDNSTVYVIDKDLVETNPREANKSYSDFAGNLSFQINVGGEASSPTPTKKPARISLISSNGSDKIQTQPQREFDINIKSDVSNTSLSQNDKKIAVINAVLSFDKTKIEAVSITEETTFANKYRKDASTHIDNSVGKVFLKYLAKVSASGFSPVEVGPKIKFKAKTSGHFSISFNPLQTYVIAGEGEKFNNNILRAISLSIDVSKGHLVPCRCPGPNCDQCETCTQPEGESTNCTACTNFKTDNNMCWESNQPTNTPTPTPTSKCQCDLGKVTENKCQSPKVAVCTSKYSCECQTLTNTSTPTPTPGAMCNTESKSGSQGVDVRKFNLTSSKGWITFEYHAYAIPDRFEVIYEGNAILDTEEVSGDGTKNIWIDGKSTAITVKVTADKSGTMWDYTLSCPKAGTPPPNGTVTPRDGNSTTLNMRLKLQGILKKPRRSDKLQIKVGIKPIIANSRIEYSTGIFTSNNYGIWTGTVKFNRRSSQHFISEKFAVYVKGPYHIQKKICDVNPKEGHAGAYHCMASDGKIMLRKGVNKLDFSQISMLVGDLPQQDGVVDSYDISYVRNSLGKRDAKSLSVADVNLDGIVDTQDYALVQAALAIRYDDF